MALHEDILHVHTVFATGLDLPQPLLQVFQSGSPGHKAEYIQCQYYRTPPFIRVTWYLWEYLVSIQILNITTDSMNNQQGYLSLNSSRPKVILLSLLSLVALPINVLEAALMIRTWAVWRRHPLLGYFLLVSWITVMITEIVVTNSWIDSSSGTSVTLLSTVPLLIDS
jgi:hypothetical protein